MSPRRSRRAPAPADRRGERAAPRGRWRLVLARPEAVPASLRRFSARARRHRLRVPLLVGGAAVVLVLAGALVVYHTSLFAVRTVRVEGNRVLTADPVRRAAAVSPGTPLAGVDLAAVGDRVSRLPAVREVQVDRDWPDGVVVRVTERTAVAAVPWHDRYRLLDASGVAFRAVSARPPALPVIVVSRPTPDDESTRAALHVLGALTPKLRAALGRIECTRPTRLRLVLRSGRTVVWGDSSRSDRKAAAATALLDRGGRTIDVSAPDLVTVR